MLGIFTQSTNTIGARYADEFFLLSIAVGVLLLAASAGAGEPGKMSFFVTSAGPGDGANLGGLAGADAHCQKLAESVAAGNRSWRAYLSTQGKDFKDQDVVNARDRIGTGPGSMPRAS